MGYVSWPVYGESLGDAIEKAEKIIAQIKTNKFDNTDVLNLVKCNTAIIEAIINED